jgi:CubicO group peptidase (beta-lactamase class C family)
MLDRARAAALALLLGLTACVEQGRPVVFASGPAGFSSEVEEHIAHVEQRARISARMAQYRVPGVSIAVVNGGVVEWARGYGLLEATGRQPVNQDTLFQAASISKVGTALVALRLVQDGRLVLDEDVNRRLSSWKVPDSPAAAGQPVTLRQLLSHSAGISVHGFRGYAAGERIPSLLDVLDGRRPANSGAIRVITPPGQDLHYSGGGFTIVQQLVGDVLGASFPDVMRVMLLEPLGMDHSTYAQPLPERYWSHAAAGHREDGQEIAGRWFIHPEMAAAGLWTTPTELGHFIVEMQSAFAGRASRVLSQPIAVQMLTRQVGSWGLGVGLSGSGAGLRFAHNGANQGFRCDMVGLMYAGQGAVVMTNSDAGGQVSAEVLRAIAAEYRWPGATGAVSAWQDDDPGEDGDVLAALDPE